jgi:hypothetical protein
LCDDNLCDTAIFKNKFSNIRSFLSIIKNSKHYLVSEKTQMPTKQEILTCHVMANQKPNDAKELPIFFNTA